MAHRVAAMVVGQRLHVLTNGIPPHEQASKRHAHDEADQADADDALQVASPILIPRWRLVEPNASQMPRTCVLAAPGPAY